jgi:hypothetical protein
MSLIDRADAFLKNDDNLKNVYFGFATGGAFLALISLFSWDFIGIMVGLLVGVDGFVKWLNIRRKIEYGEDTESDSPIEDDGV